MRSVAPIGTYRAHLSKDLFEPIEQHRQLTVDGAPENVVVDHLAVRMGEVSLSRSMRTIHQKFAQSFNGRHRVFGPLWQGRYRSRSVEDENHLRQLIAYIHLNPVVAWVVKDASRYRWCRHREVLGKAVGRRLVDVCATLLAFHPKRRSALAGYRSMMRTTLGCDWRSEGPGRLPWWRIGRPSKSDDESEIVVEEEPPRIQMDGLSSIQGRPRIELGQFLETGAAFSGVLVEDLRSRRRQARIVEARETLAWLGVELCGLTVKEMAAGLEKYIETTSRLASRAAHRRMVDEGFAKRLGQVDSEVGRLGD